MKKSEIMKAFREVVDRKHELIKDCAKKARDASYAWERESERRIAKSFARDVYGAADLMQQMGFLDWEDVKALYDEARAMADAVGNPNEEQMMDAC